MRLLSPIAVALLLVSCGKATEEAPAVVHDCPALCEHTEDVCGSASSTCVTQCPKRVSDDEVLCIRAASDCKTLRDCDDGVANGPEAAGETEGPGEDDEGPVGGGPIGGGGSGGEGGDCSNGYDVGQTVCSHDDAEDQDYVVGCANTAMNLPYRVKVACEVCRVVPDDQRAADHSEQAACCDAGTAAYDSARCQAY